ncbi:MAG TPA: hypothetical protein VN428_14520 [Bryobacteraceae bacterium]|nr:hypothetical protein [Bryobacteraceae bacterium]
MIRTLALLCLVAGIAAAQPRAPEIFGHVGRFRLAGDEGSLGSGASLGGAVTVPIPVWPKWAIDVDVVSARTEHEGRDNEFWNRRRTLLVPALVRRWSFTDRAIFFAGGGLGVRFDSTQQRYCVFAAPANQCQLVNASDSARDGSLGLRMGVVINPVSRLLVRGGVFTSWTHVLPDAGIRIGIGLRIQ